MSLLTRTLPTSASTQSRRRNLVIGVSVLLAFSYGLQMYGPVSAFAMLVDDFSLSLGQVGILVSMFFLGYAGAHVPSGLAAAAFGLKRLAVGGGMLLVISTLLFSMANDYGVLLISRAIGGVAMSAIVAGIFPLATAWAPPGRERLVVGGFLNGVGFTSGAAVGLYVWTFFMDLFGWRVSSLFAAVIGVVITILAVMILRTPQNMEELEGGQLSWKNTFRCLKNRSIWAIGIGSVCGYGVFFTVSQLGPGYAESNLGFSASTAGLLGVAMLLLGIPGALVGGQVADRAKRFLPTLWIPAAGLVAILFLLPLANGVMIWFVLCAAGFLGMFYLSPATVSQAEYPEDIRPQDQATALGLILTLGNAGAVVFPSVYAFGAETLNPTIGWWMLGGLGTLAWLAIFLAREPRKAKSQAPELEDSPMENANA